MDLPVVGQADHFSRFIELREQVSDSFCLVRQDQIRPDIRQRLQNEFSPMQTRMWQLQTGIVDFHLAQIKKVDVDLARDVSRMIAFPSKRFLDSDKVLKQVN